jgi:adenylosuccinate lyase
MAALENVALWHERDISHSSVERIILPDSCTLLDYMLVTLTKLVSRLLVYPENMKRNMEITGGLYASQSALLMLTERGMERKDAYEAVQRAAMKTWKDGGGLAKNLSEEPTVSSHLSAADIEHACAPERHFRFVEDKFRAVGIAG